MLPSPNQILWQKKTDAIPHHVIPDSETGILITESQTSLHRGSKLDFPPYVLVFHLQ